MDEKRSEDKEDRSRDENGMKQENRVSKECELSKEDQIREQALKAFREENTEERLWKCVVAFQNYPFYTSSGLPFTYRLKVGRNGSFTKELFIDRRENSKSLAWSSVRMAFQRAVKMDGTIKRPKDIGDIRGVSYSYSILWRFGVISVPEETEKKLRGGSGLRLEPPDIT